MNQYTIRKMQAHEVQIAINWAQNEGWNPGIHDAHCFYQTDSQGFFIGYLNKEPIAVGSAVIYGEHYAFCGLYIVKSEYRDHGYGLELTQERLKYVGQRITGLDGVLDKVSKYERLGYVSAYKQIRYELNNVPHLRATELTDLKTMPFQQLETFDRLFFPAARSAFLQNWIHQKDAFALGYMEHGVLCGYGVIRKCHRGYKIGPLFANTPDIAKVLFETLSSKATCGPIYLDVPEPNDQARELVKHYKMAPQFEVIRMYRNGYPKVNEQGIFGVTTFELG